MKRPTSLRIGGRVWPVRWRKQAGCCGQTNYDTAAITVRPGMTPFDTRDTALHEAFHAILYQQGHTSFGNEEEEKYVRSLSTGLMGVLQDNPEFARWLIEPLTTS